MEKRYQVFVSSTFSDLKEERQAVTEALLSLDHFPAGMELFPASDEDQLTLIKGVIDDSDYYVLVVAGRYGSTGADGISYTEKEFDYAALKGKPILAFVHQDRKKIPSGKTDEDDVLRKKLDAFQKKVEHNRHVKYWTNPDDLKAKVIQGIAAETKRNPQEGWARAGSSTNPAVVESLRQEIDRLRNKAAPQITAPPGTEIYAFGDDPVEIEFVCEDQAGKDISKFAMVTWNQVFTEVGPLLLEEASEDQIRERLSEELWRYDHRKFPAKVSEIEVSNDGFDDVKIQLLALGLMEKSKRMHVPSDKNRYWSLTPYGEATLMRVRAKRRPETKPDQA